MERANQFVGQSLAFLDAVERASRAAPLNRPVLVIGERGTGKELIAERLHHLSPRWAGPLVVMNCAALPETLIEAELFGHEAGSFTGASKTRHGRFEEADGGTLFLDELGTLSSPAQDRLLRAVEYGEITRIGASKPISVDVRIVAATNENLPDAGGEGQVPRRPPRSPVVRGGDPAAASREERGRALARRPFRAPHGGRAGLAKLAGLFARAVAEFEAYNWPGNVRELRNVVERAVYRWEDPERQIDAIQFDPFHSPWAPTAVAGAACRACGAGSGSVPAAEPAAVAPSATTSDFRAAVSEYERALLQNALAANRFNQRATATALNLSYDQLRHALKRHKLLETDAA